MSGSATESSSKRPRISDVHMEDAGKALIVVPQPSKAADKDSDGQDLISHPLLTLPLSFNPSYVKSMIMSNVAGYDRPPAEHFVTPIFYEIEHVNIRNSITAIIKNYCKWKYLEAGRMTATQINTEVDKLAPITADACMCALYAKLRVVNKQYSKYASRYQTASIYAKELELPLPFADAIQSIGPFTTQCIGKNNLIVPVHKEGVKNEGRKDDDFFVDQYETAMTMLRSIGIPLKSVDTRAKSGTPFWTYKVEYTLSRFDLKCVLPPLHYTDHSCVLALMFVCRDSENKVLPLYSYSDTDLDYGYYFREAEEGIQLRAFSALCQKPSSEWNLFTTLV